MDQGRLIRADTLLGLLFLGLGLLLMLIVALALFFTPSVLIPGGQSAGSRKPADKAKPALAPAPAGPPVLLPDPASPDSALNNVSADERLSEISHGRRLLKLLVCPNRTRRRLNPHPGSKAMNRIIRFPLIDRRGNPCAYLFQPSK